MKKYTKYILIALFPGIILTFYQCPSLFLLGIPCPFCGMTRAFLCVLHGDILRAFYFHPLWPVVLAAGIVFLLVHMKLLRLSDQLINIAASVVAILFLLCFILRHLDNSPVVQINLSRGFLFK